MAQHKQAPHHHAHKPAPAHSHAAHSHARAAEPKGTAAQAQDKALEAGRENVENLMHTAETCTRTAGRLAGICSDNMGAMAESGNRASRIAQDMTAEILDSSSRTLSDCTGISREALACRTLGDMMELHNKAMQQLSDNCFVTAGRLSNIMFTGCTEALEPFYERTAINSGHLRRAMAA